MNKVNLIETFEAEGYVCFSTSHKDLIEEQLGIRNPHDHFLLLNNKTLTDASATIAYGFNMTGYGDNSIRVSYYNKHVSRLELGLTHVVVHTDNDELIDKLLAHARSLTKSLITLAESK